MLKAGPLRVKRTDKDRSLALGKGEVLLESSCFNTEPGKSQICYPWLKESLPPNR
jgi:hypothetical protein